MSKKQELKNALEENVKLKSENLYLKNERMDLSSSIARLKRELSEARLRYSDLAEKSQGLHGL